MGFRVSYDASGRQSRCPCVWCLRLVLKLGSGLDLSINKDAAGAVPSKLRTYDLQILAVVASRF